MEVIGILNNLNLLWFYNNPDGFHKKKFTIGDKVIVNGFDDKVFEVIEYGDYIFFDGKSYNTKTIYTIWDIEIDEVYYVYEEDLRRYKGLNQNTKSNKPKQNNNQLSESTKKIIDNYLDEYNDLMRLYMTFGDIEYLTRSDEIMKRLRSMFK